MDGKGMDKKTFQRVAVSHSFGWKPIFLSVQVKLSNIISYMDSSYKNKNYSDSSMR